MGLSGLFFRDKTGAETPVEAENVMSDDGTIAATTGTLMTQAESPELVKLRADFEQSQAKIKALETQAAAAESKELAGRIASVKAVATTFAAGLVSAKTLMPVGRDPMANLHAYAHLSAAGLPTEGIDPVASLNGVVAGLVPHNLTGEAVADAAVASSGVFRIENGSAGTLSPEARQARASADLEAYYARQGIKPSHVN